MKHTPEPWTYYWHVADNGETDCGVVNHRGYSVCRAPRYQKKDQWEADARLIVKAPEMYELLKEYWKQPLGASAVIKRDDAAKALLKEIEGDENGTR